MRTTLFFPLALAATVGLSACSEKAQDSAAETADAVGDDAAKAGAAIGNAAEKGADAAADAASDAGNAIGNAADKAAAETDELGEKAENAGARIEADAHNESVTEAKRD